MHNTDICFSKDGAALRKAETMDETGVTLAGEYSLFELMMRSLQ